MKPFDPGTELKLKLLMPEFKEKIQLLLSNSVSTFRVTDGFRSMESQSKLYDIGRISKGRTLTNARPGFSFHNYGLAVDLCQKSEKPYEESAMREIGQLSQLYGLTWGGDFKSVDQPHVQIKTKITATEMFDIFLKSGIEAVWTKVRNAK